MEFSGCEVDEDVFRDLEGNIKTEKIFRGCFLEVDPEYQRELHDLHNEFPLYPETIL